MTFTNLVEALDEELYTHPEWADLEVYFVHPPNNKALVPIDIGVTTDSVWIELGIAQEKGG